MIVPKIKKILKVILYFVPFFLLLSFVVTCCFLLFLRSMDLDVALVTQNAKVTFLNIIFLSFLVTSMDFIRRKLTIERNVKKISKSLKEITAGNFDVKIATVPSVLDTTNLNTIINDINLMTEELSGLENLRSDFISSVSHEMKTPLTVIKNYATILQSPDLEEEKRLEYAKAISDASGRLASMVTNVLKLNKLENQQIFPTAGKYDLGEQLRECILGFENELEKKDIEIETDIPDDVVIRADSELLSLVWNNLISNAIKFTADGGKVSVSLKDEEHVVLVTVKDTGCGMSATVGEHIFEKFYQGDSSHATKGNGLGLALVKRVIDITGSEIFVDSTVGEGSTFTVKLFKKRLI